MFSLFIFCWCALSVCLASSLKFFHTAHIFICGTLVLLCQIFVSFDASKQPLKQNNHVVLVNGRLNTNDYKRSDLAETSYSSDYVKNAWISPDNDFSNMYTKMMFVNSPPGSVQSHLCFLLLTLIPRLVKAVWKLSAV